MPRRVFTVTDVNRLIPQLERIFTEVLQCHGSLRRQEAKLQSLGVPPSKEILSGEDDDGSPAVRHAKSMFRAFYEMMIESLGQVDDLGGQVKDLETGLVDFPGRRGSDDILLCWKLGEKAVGHWHPIDSGFSGRRPLDHLVPQEPTHLD